jgi:hypothetical protein
MIAPLITWQVIDLARGPHHVHAMSTLQTFVQNYIAV